MLQLISYKCSLLSTYQNAVLCRFATVRKFGVCRKCATTIRIQLCLWIHKEHWHPDCGENSPGGGTFKLKNRRRRARFSRTIPFYGMFLYTNIGYPSSFLYIVMQIITFAIEITILCRITAYLGEQTNYYRLLLTSIFLNKIELPKCKHSYVFLLAFDRDFLCVDFRILSRSEINIKRQYT